MKSIADYAKAFVIKKEDLRKDAERRKLITEITNNLNVERRKDNEGKIDKYRWTNECSKEVAIKYLSKLKDPKERIYDEYTERGVYFKTRHLQTPQLRDFRDMLNEASKDGRSYGKVFNGSLRIK